MAIHSFTGIYAAGTAVQLIKHLTDQMHSEDPQGLIQLCLRAYIQGGIPRMVHITRVMIDVLHSNHKHIFHELDDD